MKSNLKAKTSFEGNSTVSPRHAYLADILLTACDGIVAFDAKERITFLNPIAEQMYGWTQSETLGKTSAELFWPHYTTQDQKDHKRRKARLKTGREIQGEFLARRKDGSAFWVEYSVRPFPDTNDRFSGYVLTCRDISERKRVEDQHQAISRLPAENPNPVMRIALDGRLLYANPAGAAILELWKQQGDRTIPDVLHRTIGEALVSGLKKEMEIRQDGKSLLFLVVPIRDAGYVNLYGIDITERKSAEEEREQLFQREQEKRLRTELALARLELAEEALAHERELLERLFETMPVMLSIYDPETNSMRFNAEFEKILGWKSEEVTVTSLLEALYPDPQYRQSVLERMAAAGRNDWVEVQVQARDGRRLDSLWANVSISKGEQLATGIALGLDITERKQAEHLYRTIARSIPGGGVYVIDKDFRYIVAEGSVAEAFGISREMLEGRTVSEIFPPESAARMEERLRLNFAGETVNFETQHEGRVYWTQQAPLLDSLGYVIVVTLDITERKQIEEALRQKDEELHRIADITPILLSRCSRDLRYLFVNRAASETLGFPPEEIIGKPIRQVMGDAAFEAIQPYVERVLRGERVEYELEIPYQSAGRRFMHVVYFPEKADDGTVTGWIATVTDLTERKRMEEQLRLSEERFTQFMQHLPGLAWIKDIQGGYVYANAAAEQAFNTPRERLYGRTDHEVFPPQVAEQFRKNDEQALLEGKGVQVIETLEQEDGIVHHSLVSKFPIPGLDGSAAMIGGIAFDITQRLQAEKALRENEKRFREIFETAGVSVWLEDFNAVRAAIEDLRAEGVHDFPRYFAEHPEFVRRAIGLVRILDVNNQTLEIFGGTSKTDLLQSLSQVFIPETEAAFATELIALAEGQEMISSETKMRTIDGRPIWVLFTVHFGSQREDYSRVVATVTDITERKQMEQALWIKARQQQAIAELGELALRERNLQRVFDHATALVADTLAVEYCKVLELQPGGTEFLLRAGVGWKAGLVGHATVGAGLDSQAGYSLESLGPVVVENLRQEHRFNGPHLLLDHDVVSGMSCIIPGPKRIPWGVIGAHSTRRVQFESDDVSFLLAVANVLGDAIHREEAEQALREHQEELQVMNETLELRVREQTAEVRKLASDLTKAEQHERDRLSHILHDDLQQRLYAIQMQMALVDGTYRTKDAEIQNEFAEIKSQINDVLAITRRLSVDLSPPILRDEGLTHAIRWLASQMQQQHGLQVELRADDPFALRDAELQVLLFSCVRELLFNVVKHAGVKQAEVALDRRNTSLQIEVRDPGMGFQLNPPVQRRRRKSDTEHKPSFGLPTMRQQLSLFGGRMDIKSEAGLGTQVILTIPVLEADWRTGSAGAK